MVILLRLRKPIGSEKAVKTCFNMFGFLFGRLRGHLEPFWGGRGASWRHAGGHLRLSCAVSLWSFDAFQKSTGNQHILLLNARVEEEEEEHDEEEEEKRY